MTQAWTLSKGLGCLPSALLFAPVNLPLAAVPDAWLIGLPIALMVIQVVVLVVQGVVVSKIGEIGKLKENLTAATKELIDARFEGVTHQISEIHERLLRGESSFNELRAADHAIRVLVIERLAEIKSDLTERCASKDDVNEIKQILMRRGLHD